MADEPSRREQAIALRKAGHSTSQIREAMGLRSGGGGLGRWLKDVPPPEWTKRPNAKDDLREKAIELRHKGWSYREIREEVPVSKSSLSLWLSDIVLTDEHRERLNVGDEYHGCLVVYVRRSSHLYQEIEGWWLGIAQALDSVGGPRSGVV